MKQILLIFGILLINSYLIIAQNSTLENKQSNIGEKDKNEAVLTVEIMPEFPGGEVEMMNFIAQNIKYPKQARAKGIEGTVVVNFIIEKDGSIEDVSIFRSAHVLLDAEALRVIYEMPKWRPGIQDGVAVRVSYNLPIRFVLGKVKKKKKTNLNK